jgi:hypothetical protein
VPQALIAIIGAVAALLMVRGRRRRRLPARAIIVTPGQATVIARDGAVRSVHSAELVVSLADLERLWNPTNLENLARTYWRFLTRVTLGLVRVVYGANERSVVLLGRPLTLLRFEAPEYEVAPDRGCVRWRIRDGLLVAKAGRGCGFLSLSVRLGSGPPVDGRVTLRIDIEVSNFYPSIAAGFSTPVYEATQSSIHVLVTHAFLRSLARLELAESKVGRLSAITDVEPPEAVSGNGNASAPAVPGTPQP